MTTSATKRAKAANSSSRITSTLLVVTRDGIAWFRKTQGAELFLNESETRSGGRGRDAAESDALQISKKPWIAKEKQNQIISEVRH